VHCDGALSPQARPPHVSPIFGRAAPSSRDKALSRQLLRQHSRHSRSLFTYFDFKQSPQTRPLPTHSLPTRWIESKSRLSAALQLQRPSTRIGSWGAPLYTPGAFHPNFRSWKKARGSPLAPLPPPASLPALPAGADGADLAGEIPTLEAAEKLLREALAAGIGDAAARRIIGSVADAEAAAVPAAPAPDARAPVAVRAAPFVTSLLEALAADGAAAATPHTAAGGAAEVAALRAYLASQQPSAALPPGLAFLREAVQKLESPANVGGSFLALLGRPLVRLGRLSVRQVSGFT
jgi:hypothetical protein